jgi:hypothetical protein
MMTRRQPHVLFALLALSAVVLSGFSSGAALAGPITFTFMGANTGGDGPVSAQATVTTFVNQTFGATTCSGLQIVIQNLQTLTGNNGEGQAISGLSFNLNGGLGSASNFLVQNQGPEVTTTSSGHSSPTAVTGTSANSFLHWGSSATASTFLLETAGTAAQPGKPNHLIAGELGAGGHYNPSYQQHDPSFLQTATFFICDPNVNGNTVLTTSDFSNVLFAFGTGPSFGGPSTIGGGPPPSVPEPASIVLAGLGIACFGGFALRRRPACPAN